MSTTTSLDYPQALKEHAKALLASLTPEPPPLRLDDNDVLCVGPTRVRLDTVIFAFNSGETPEEILADFPSLTLPTSMRSSPAISGTESSLTATWKSDRSGPR